MHTLTKKEAIGFVNFDSAAGKNNEIEIRIPFERIKQIARGKYLIVESKPPNEFFLARLSRGPFFTPDAVNRDSAFARASIVQASDIDFLPDYHGICFAELIGVFDLDASHLAGIQTRPHPKAPVFPLPPEKLESLLRLDGNMYVGQLTGYDDIRVRMNSNSKSVLPRNIGIFGTVGSGKTNSSQVLIEEASSNGWAVIVIDVEGEYISMDQPSSEIMKNKGLQAKAEKEKIKPEGLTNFHVLFPAGAESNRTNAFEFSIPFGSLSAYELSEIMGMNDTQSDRFISLWDAQKEKILGGGSGGARKRGKVNQWAKLEQGDGEEIDEYPDLTIDGLLTSLNDRLKEEKGASKSSWLVVKRLLGRLKRFGIFDSTEDLLDIPGLVKAGKVSVLDLSNSVTVQVNNIIIAYLLRKIFELKIKEESLPPTIIFIEEAHTFVSRENASKMETLMDRLREVTRRGRKRWLSLCFISQQPSHLPDEIFELCNTKVIHQTTGTKNLNALKVSGGNVNEAIWDDVPVLGQGRSIIISPQFQHPIMTNMRVCKTNREHTD